MKKSIYLVGALLFSGVVLAQKGRPENWYLLDPSADKVYGAGIEEAYKTLGERKGEKVIVAVIDSGVEVDHEDLKDVIWTNEDEIPNNGIDDDKNGYIDDVHGWSFLGGAKEDINYEALELARIYQDLEPKYSSLQEYEVPGDKKEEYKYWLKIQVEYEEEMNANMQQYQTMLLLLDYMDRVEKQTNQSFSKAANKAYDPGENGTDQQLQKIMKLILLGSDPGSLRDELEHGAEAYGGMVEYSLMDADSLRRAVVGDNPDDLTEKFYGCNRYEGPDAMHGSHVSGIIAASRTNDLGIIGEAKNVEIMVLRAVPNGDERDKDVANAIYYAVDNGAKVINMSFGKYYSPNKDAVDAAVKYAQDHDVLLVHAAGNDAKNKDVEDSYPMRYLNDGSEVTNWLEVGASSYKKGKNLIASFSNYGKTKVDLFAPGVDIHSTVPDQKYEDASGTSMASPSAAGVAAIIRSYFPELTAAEVRDVMMKTVVPYKGKVLLPGGEVVETKKGPKTKKTKVTLEEISITGGFVNCNNAVKYLMEQGK
ncbi:MAG: S8 family serine peptidase [Flavobacteriales bacterium]|nr:S8 family serine peptidase [Flavobacteriales bacterium]